jgi:hypothetical protein
MHLQPSVPERANKEIDLKNPAGALPFLYEGATCNEVDLTRTAGETKFLAEGERGEEVDLTKSAGEKGAIIFLFFIRASAIFFG